MAVRSHGESGTADAPDGARARAEGAVARAVHWTGVALIVIAPLALRSRFELGLPDGVLLGFTLVSVYASVAAPRGERRYDPWAFAACWLSLTAHLHVIKSFDEVARSGGQMGPEEALGRLAPPLVAFFAAGLLGAVSLARIALTRGRLRGFGLAAFSLLHAPLVCWILLWPTAMATELQVLGESRKGVDATVPFLLYVVVAFATIFLLGWSAWKRWCDRPVAWRTFCVIATLFVLAQVALGLRALSFEAERSTYERLPFSRTAEPDVVPRTAARMHLHVGPDGARSFGRSPATVLVAPRTPRTSRRWGIYGDAGERPETYGERLDYVRKYRRALWIAVDVDAEARCEGLVVLVDELRAHDVSRFHLAVRRERVPLTWAEWVLGTRPTVRDSGRFLIELEPDASPRGLALGASDADGFELDGESFADRAELAAAFDALRRDDPAPVLLLRPAPDATYARLVEVIDLLRERVPGARLAF